MPITESDRRAVNMMLAGMIEEAHEMASKASHGPFVDKVVEVLYGQLVKSVLSLKAVGWIVMHAKGGMTRQGCEEYAEDMYGEGMLREMRKRAVHGETFCDDPGCQSCGEVKNGLVVALREMRQACFDGIEKAVKQMDKPGFEASYEEIMKGLEGLKEQEESDYGSPKPEIKESRLIYLLAVDHDDARQFVMVNAKEFGRITRENGNEPMLCVSSSIDLRGLRGGRYLMTPRFADGRTAVEKKAKIMGQLALIGATPYVEAQGVG